MSEKTRFRFGYRAMPFDEGRWAYVLIKRDLGPTDLARLEEDLRRLSAGLLQADAALVDLDVPLSRGMSIALARLSDKLELPMTLSVPALSGRDQMALNGDFLRASSRRFRIEIRAD
jgi:hypothetical protein